MWKALRLGEATFGMSSGFERPSIWVVRVLVISLLVSSPQAGLSAQIPKLELLGLSDGPPPRAWSHPVPRGEMLQGHDLQGQVTPGTAGSTFY